MSALLTLTDKSPQIREIERLGFEWDLDPEFDLSRLSDDKRVQVRDSEHYAPKHTVESYANQLAETAFDPIVTTLDDYLVDGNTRKQAYLTRGQKRAPVLVLKTKYEKAPTKVRLELEALAATLNCLNGVRLTPAEGRRAVRAFIELKWKTEEIARSLGVGESTVNAVRREMAGEKRLSAVGMPANGNLKGTSVRALGHKDVVALNNDPFKGLAELAVDAGFNQSEIVTTAKTLKEAGSDTAAMNRLTEIRTEMANRIRDQKLTGRSRPPVARVLRQHLGYALKFKDQEGDLIEVDPASVAKHTEVLEDTIAVLTEVLRLQAEWTPTVSAS